jgi:hypothetical protein
MTLTAILGFYSASTFAGYFWGKATSPDDSTILTTFFNKHHTCRLVAPASTEWSEQLSSLPIWDQTSPVVVELSIRTPNRQYVYRSDTDKVRPNFLSPGELAAVRRPIFSRILSREADRFALLTTEMGIMNAATPVLVKARGLLAVLKGKYGVAIGGGVAIVGCGAAFGYIMGHKWEPDYDSPAFHSALMESDQWRAAAKQYCLRPVMPANAPDASPHR